MKIVGTSSLHTINNNIKTKRENKEPDALFIKSQQDEISKLEKQLAELKASGETEKKQEAHTVVSMIAMHEVLDSEPYKHISRDEGYKMLGYFTENGYKEGYPWKLYKSSGKDGKTEKINIVEACNRLAKGEEVVMQPMRKMDVNLSASEIGVLAGAVNPASAVASSMMYLSTTSPVSHEIKLGPSVYIRNFGELKLLKELYDPSLDVPDNMMVSKAANNLSKFLHATNANCPWKILKNDGDIKTSDVIKGSIRKGFMWTLGGAGMGAVIGGVLGALAQSILSTSFGWTAAAVTGGLGAVGAGVAGLIKGGKKVLKGKEINAFEALNRVIDNKPVILQKQEVRGMGVPVFGTLNFLADYEDQNIITGSDELKSFANILSIEKPEGENKKTGGVK